MERNRQKPITKPSRAGKQNMTEEVVEGSKLSEKNAKILKSVLSVADEGIKVNKGRTSAWTAETLEKSTTAFLLYCVEVGIEPSISLYRTWLNVSNSTYWEWKQGRDGKADVIKRVEGIMEAMYHSKLDDVAIPNMFKLKTQFGYVETSRQLSESTVHVDEDTIENLVQKLGLDK